MRIHAYLLALALLLAGSAQAAPVIELELATESGLQITAPQQWLQLLTRLGVENVQIRGTRPGDAPAVSNRGTAERPRYHVLGILNAREQLRLPGESFTRGDAKRLADYFERLSADGDERLTASEVRFGLTEKELTAALAELSRPLDLETKGQSPRAIIERLQSQFKQPMTIDPQADQALRDGSAFGDELKGISTGTALAMLLRNYELVFRPEKNRGQAVTYQVALARGVSASAGGQPRGSEKPPAPTEDDHAGKIANIRQKNWPIGWEIDKSPGAAAPSMFDKLSAEIDGFTLAETLDAIGPRLKLPYFVDHSGLAAAGIRPAEIKVKIERGEISYMRLLERVLAQSRLGCQLRADEAGRVFLWISR